MSGSPPASTDIRLLQVAYGDEEPLARRVERVANLVRQQQGADLVVLPELWAHGGFSYQSWQEEAEPLTGPTISALREAARDAQVVLHGGSVIERPADSSALYNTAVVIDRHGEITATYRKMHRFGFSEGEPQLLTAGDQVATVELDLAGRSVPTGLATCYDLRFPELFRMLTYNGMQVLFLVAAWPKARVDHWRVLAQARAVENQVVVLACNTAGTHAGVTMGGHSMIVDAQGRVLAEAGDTEEVLSMVLDLGGVDTARASFPVLLDRRF
ncbi:carbon-nitrogen family hydrolase [Klenkia terrae]|uniref:Carbon-nitrogen family hydrolase n=1 Tax=Klenkia terrae TaxID=1052259 RepID=A0ABU8E487_9ACTN|nr:carbon-nitrogen family hydrolase [Klenkia terrae]